MNSIWEPVAELARKAAEEFFEWQDCTCADGEEFGSCWYRYSDEEQRAMVAEHVRGRLEMEFG